MAGLLEQWIETTFLDRLNPLWLGRYFTFDMVFLSVAHWGPAHQVTVDTLYNLA